MTSIVGAITKFQNVALITTAGAIGYWYYQDLGKVEVQEEDPQTSVAAPSGSQKGHTLTGDVIDKDKQVNNLRPNLLYSNFVFYELFTLLSTSAP